MLRASEKDLPVSLVFSTFLVRIQQKNNTIKEAGYFCERNVRSTVIRSTEKILTGNKLGNDKDKMHQNEIEGALIFMKFFDRIFVKVGDGSGIVEECQIHLNSVVGII